MKNNGLFCSRLIRASKMQIVVVPVTTKLLVKSNSAMDVEALFAFAKKIPILSLMQ